MMFVSIYKFYTNILLTQNIRTHTPHTNMRTLTFKIIYPFKWLNDNKFYKLYKLRYIFTK